MERYTIYCTEEQTKKALALGAPIEVETIFACDYETSRDNKVHVSEHLAKSAPYQEYAIIPTTEQMVGWLEAQNIYLEPRHTDEEKIHVWVGSFTPLPDGVWTKSYSTIKEATLAAIDVALDYLIKVKEE